MQSTTSCTKTKSQRSGREDKQQQHSSSSSSGSNRRAAEQQQSKQQVTQSQSLSLSITKLERFRFHRLPSLSAFTHSHTHTHKQHMKKRTQRYDERHTQRKTNCTHINTHTHTQTHLEKRICIHLIDVVFVEYFMLVFGCIFILFSRKYQIDKISITFNN